MSLECAPLFFFGVGSGIVLWFISRDMKTKLATYIMAGTLVCFASVILLTGCGNKTQTDIYYRITQSFRVPEEQTARTDFYKKVCKRCSLPDNVHIIEYDYHTHSLVYDEKDFYDSAVIVVRLLVASTNDISYIVHEEWYHYAFDEPILLRRHVRKVEGDRVEIPGKDIMIERAELKVNY